MDPTLCYISVAGNIDPERHLPEAVRRLKEVLALDAASIFFRTPALGRPDERDYLNGVVRGAWDGAPRDLKYRVLRPLEAALGRVRTADKYAARTLDLDLLLFDDCCVNDPDLTLPDPDLWRRPFLAAAVLNIDPDLAVPGLNRRLDELADSEEIARLQCAEAVSRIIKEIVSA